MAIPTSMISLKYKKCIVTLAFAILAYYSVMWAVNSSQVVIPRGLTELSNSHIDDIAQDSIGFMWFATPTGLFRYDGYALKSYHTSDGDVAYQGFKKLDKDGAGNLWIQTYDRIFLYDYTRDCLVPQTDTLLLKIGIRSNAGKLSVDQDGGVWMVGNGVLTYIDYKKGKSRSREFKSKHNIVSVAARGKWKIALSQQGYLFNMGNNGIPALMAFKYKASNSDSDVSMFIDKQQRLWIIDAAGSVPYTCISLVTGNPVDISPVRRLIGSDHINAINEDEAGNMWIGTDQKGVIVMDKGGECKHLTKIHGNNSSLPSVHIECLYASSNGIWVGSSTGGIALLPERSGQAECCLTNETSKIQMIAEDKFHNIWVAHDRQGLRCYEPGNTSRYFTPVNSGLPNETVLSSAIDNKGRMWFCSYGGGVFFYENGQFVVPEAIKRCEELSLTRDIAFDDNGILWIASEKNGLFSLDRDGLLTKYRDRHQINTDYLTALGYNHVTRRLYIGTSIGLYVCDVNTGNTKLVNLYDPRLSKIRAYPCIYDIYSDKRGNTWICSDRGVDIISVNGKVMRHVGYADGLGSDNAKSITGDASGRIWIGGEGCYSCITTDNKGLPQSVRSFKGYDGDRPVNPVKGAISMSHDNHILMGCEGLYLKIDPSSLTGMDKKKYNVIFTDLVVGGEFRRSLHECSEVQLQYNDYFTIQMSALTFDSSHSERFRYRLSKQDDWVYLGDNTMQFNKLHYGTYHLEAQVLQPDGTYSRSSCLKLVITPPWWYSYWAKFCYIVVLVVGLVLIIMFLRKRHITEMERQRIEMEDKSKQDIEEAQIRILTNVIDDTLLNKFSGLVTEHLDDMNYSVDQLSQDLGMSRSGLYKKLMSITQKSPLELMRFIRLKRGKEILDGGENSISQVSYQVGLSPKQFAKYFKQVYGQLPSEYIRQRNPAISVSVNEASPEDMKILSETGQNLTQEKVIR